MYVAVTKFRVVKRIQSFRDPWRHVECHCLSCGSKQEVLREGNDERAVERTPLHRSAAYTLDWRLNKRRNSLVSDRILPLRNRCNLAGTIEA